MCPIVSSGSGLRAGTEQVSDVLILAKACVDASNACLRKLVAGADDCGDAGGGLLLFIDINVSAGKCDGLEQPESRHPGELNSSYFVLERKFSEWVREVGAIGSAEANPF
jgi:hypothetical protein